MADPSPSERDISFMLDERGSLRELFDGLGELHDQFQELLNEPSDGDTDQHHRESVNDAALDFGLDALRRELEGIVLPEYQEWKQEERSMDTPSSMQRRSILSLPIVSKMEDHEKINQVISARGQPREILLAESTTATVEMIKEEPEISKNAGMTPETMVDELGKLLSKFEVPMGLMNKLMMLSEYEVLEFMIDDCDSMAMYNTEGTGDIHAPQSRWQEAQERLKELIEILAYVPFQQITIKFLNRSTVISLERNDRDPAAFLVDAIAQIEQEFETPPAGTSLFLEKLTESLTESPGRKIARWYFGDGNPEGGDTVQPKIVNLVMNRENPADNPVTFVSISNVDDDVEWMKDLEEIAPYCDEFDDYHTEAGEVLRDQGGAMPYSQGFHLVGTLVGAMNPEDLDAMDESVPFTKTTLDNLLGIQHTEEMYLHYFRCFQVAQSKREAKSDGDKLKKYVEWNYDEFLTTSVSSDIPTVQRYNAELRKLAASIKRYNPLPPEREASFMLHQRSSLRELFDGLGELHDQFQELLNEPIDGATDQDHRSVDDAALDDGLDALRRELEGVVLPEYQEWKQEERPVDTPSSMSRRSILSLPIVSKMQDHEKINQVISARGQPREILLAESTTSAVEMIKEEPEISKNAGMKPETMVDELGKLLSKFEVPMGLMNKLMMLSEFEVLEFMIDDSGSMALHNTDVKGNTQATQSRWHEAQERLKELIEILAYVPFQQITIKFLNRSTVISLERNDRDPAAFLADAIVQIEQEFAKPPAGTSLFLEKLTESLTESPGRKIARWYFGDGNPEGGETSQEQIVHLVMNRENPADNPVTFVSISNVDDDVEWMKDLEEIAPYCDEFDDYHTEAGEVLRDQGGAMPYSQGFHLVGTLVGAMNPEDLDAMDESVPFTKTTLDNLLGIRQTEEMYLHYFRCFQVAQSKREAKSDGDKLKKYVEWNYDEFLAASVSSDIPTVQSYNAELRKLAASIKRHSIADPLPPEREASFLLAQRSSIRELFDGLGELHDQFLELLNEPFDGDTDQDHRSVDDASLDDGLDALRRDLEGIVLPEFQEWKQEERSMDTTSFTQTRSILSLPIVSKMQDHEKINQIISDRGQPGEILLAEATTAAVEMIKEEPEISKNAGMTPETMVDELGNLLSKFEVPMGLMNKLMMLSEFEVLEFMIDDSGSMALHNTDVKGSTQATQSRWHEAQERLKELIEILAYVPFQQITIEFLNRASVISLERNDRDPAAFLADAIVQIEQEFAKPPAGTSLFLEKLTKSLTESPGRKIARWYFGDGKPAAFHHNSNVTAQGQIVNLVMNRENPADNPLTFVSISNVDEDVEWMKDLEEIAPYCDEFDDYHTEAGEVLRDQGAAMPYSQGFHLVGTLVGAMNPEDLDAMDESVPFTKTTLDNLLGIRQTEEMYLHYFRCFQVAQRKREAKSDGDKLKKYVEWNYDDFLTASVSSDIPAVQSYNAELRKLAASIKRHSIADPLPPEREASFLLAQRSSIRELFDGLDELHDQFLELLNEPIDGATDQDHRRVDDASLDDGLGALRRDLEGIVLPEFQEWKQEERSMDTTSFTQTRSILSLPIVSKMQDHEKINQIISARGQPGEILLAESTAAAVEMIKEEPEISKNAGMTPETMVDELGKLLSKFEVPMGLMNKLMMLSEFEVLEFMIDDSGSMALHNTDVKGNTQAPQSRWQEAQARLKELIEILAYVPFQQITIEFLNRASVISLERNDRDPATFLADANAKIEQEFAKPPAGTSLFLEKLTQSLTESPGMKIARWYFGDGKPQGGDAAQEKIVNLVMSRENPADNPVTFVSITNVDEDVEWMKDLEEIAPYCSEYDDYHTEAGEVLRDQGAAMPYSQGFHLVGTLVGAMNPDDLDAMDESVPFTKTTMDNLLGIRQTEEMYRHYFRCLQVAQRKRQVNSQLDRLKKYIEWNYDDFLTASVSSDIPAVKRYNAELKRVAGY